MLFQWVLLKLSVEQKTVKLLWVAYLSSVKLLWVAYLSSYLSSQRLILEAKTLDTAILSDTGESSIKYFLSSLSS
jgi:hypothetical protein